MKNLLPMQFLGPWMKGIYALMLAGVAEPGIHRSGSNFSGSGQYAGSIWMALIQTSTFVPAGRNSPMSSVSQSTLRATLATGEYMRRVSRIMAVKYGSLFTCAFAMSSELPITSLISLRTRARTVGWSARHRKRNVSSEVVVWWPANSTVFTCSRIWRSVSLSGPVSSRRRSSMSRTPSPRVTPSSMLFRLAAMTPYTRLSMTSRPCARLAPGPMGRLASFPKIDGYAASSMATVGGIAEAWRSISAAAACAPGDVASSERLSKSIPKAAFPMISRVSLRKLM
mmetsp:Transcript_1599/g.5649  ORF Transcript_1599/g.5649 Transcript_1599/m.5649 type:complete len:283 (-) Transcript_1599:633-1481(-)